MSEQERDDGMLREFAESALLEGADDLVAEDVRAEADKADEADEAIDEVAAGAAVDPILERRLLRAVETYKVACLAAGEEPTEEESWLVFLSALSQDSDK